MPEDTATQREDETPMEEAPAVETEVEVEAAPAADQAEAAQAEAAPAPAAEAAPVAPAAEDPELGRLRQEVATLRVDLAAAREALGAWALSTALTRGGLPPKAGPLVSMLYAEAVRCGESRNIVDWLVASLGDPQNPVSALLPASPPPVEDPRTRLPGSVSTSALAPFPSIGASR